MDINALPQLLFRLFSTSRVSVSEVDGVVEIAPVKEEDNSLAGLVGMFAGDPNMSVEKFMERKREDAKLDR
jgi:hypothetical protein